ncbi:MAG: transcriptional regulator [Rhodospirillaceae bacterium]|nr:MAG: transcriptional regulator [Rhodospirillaceae bacterium]
MEPDEIIHQSLRLKIMAALNPLTESESLEFTRVKAIVGATDGNLGSHIATLENAGYIKVEKDFVGKKPRTRVSITKAGRRAFARHVAYLRDVLDGAAIDSGQNKTAPV